MQPESPPKFTTFTHHIFTGLAKYDAKCKETGLNPFADYTRFMQIMQATIQIKTNGRIS